MDEERPRAQPPPAWGPVAWLSRIRCFARSVLPWCPRHNPLCRPTDRLRPWLRLALALAVLVAAPSAAWAVGGAANHRLHGAADHRSRTGHRAEAVLLRTSPGHPEPGSEEARHARYPVPVRYTDGSGEVRTAVAQVPPALPAGSTVRVWTDGRGRVTGPPMSAAGIRTRTAGWAATAAVTVVVAGALACLAVERAVDRRNLAAWDRAWATTAPRWTLP